MQEIALVTNGYSNYVIIRPENASASNVTAAEELKRYLKLICGAELEIKTDAEEPSACEIAVGYTNRSKNIADIESRLGKDGFIIKSVDKRVFILGSGVRGALYGVYNFLEEYLGCRFYTSEYEKIPSRDTVTIPFIECNEQIPVFEYRHIDFITSRKNNFQAKLKANGMISDEAFGGHVTYTGFVHTFNNLVPPSLYGESHPEYWGLDEKYDIQKHRYKQLCLTNPDVLRIAKDSVRKLLAQNPETDILSISQNDSGPEGMPCQCAKCRAVYEAEGSYSGAIIRFVNDIAGEFAEEFPRVKFDTLAYRYSRAVCKTRPADNVIVRLCTIECCFSHPLGTCRDVYQKPGVTTSIYEDIVAWGKITNNVYIWDYVTNFAHPTIMFPNFNTLLPNVKFFADHSVTGVYEEGNYFSETGDFSDLRSYIMSKILWNPYMSEERYWEYIDEFLRDVYGDGWRYIREYIDIAQDIVRERHFGIYDTPKQLFFDEIENDAAPLPVDITLEKIRNYKSIDLTPYLGYYREILDSELVTRGDELFASAYAAADETQKERIDKIKLQLDFLMAYLMHYKRVNKGRNIKMLLERFFADDEEGKKLSEAERTELTDQVLKYISKCVCNEEKIAYAKYCQELFERALRYQVVRFKENRRSASLEGDTIDCKQEPSMWL